MQLSNTGGVSNTPPVLDTGGLIRTRSPQIAKRFQPLAGARVQKAVLAQDGHTPAEQLIYSALYNSGEGVAAYRDVSVGNSWIINRTGLSERTVQLNLKSLQTKLSIDLVRRHDPDTNSPNVWRVYSFESILERRRAAGLNFIARKRGGGVRLLAGATDTGGVSDTGGVFDTPPASETPPVSDTPGAPVSDTGAPPVSDTPPLGNLLGKTSRESSSSAPAAIVAALRRYAFDVDDDATLTLVEACRQIAPDASDDEIVYFIHAKGGSGAIRRPLGFLLTAVPRCFEGESFRQFRNERQQGREELNRREQEQLRHARQVLGDPATPDEEKQWALEVVNSCGRCRL